MVAGLVVLVGNGWSRLKTRQGFVGLGFSQPRIEAVHWVLTITAISHVGSLQQVLALLLLNRIAGVHQKGMRSDVAALAF